MNNFLPEDDLDYLQGKEINFELQSEAMPDSKERRGVLFKNFKVPRNLLTYENGALVLCQTCNLVVLIPDGYATTKLDSFYTSPRLKRVDGTDPDRANGETPLFGRTWQFWSRHLDENDWRVGIDGLGTFLSYIQNELRSA
ncbi:MAG: E2/UBC family protein [Georgfuchsia sp.]